jgi:hypothetical protein
LGYGGATLAPLSLWRRSGYVYVTGTVGAIA